MGRYGPRRRESPAGEGRGGGTHRRARGIELRRVSGAATLWVAVGRPGETPLTSGERLEAVEVRRLWCGGGSGAPVAFLGKGGDAEMRLSTAEPMVAVVGARPRDGNGAAGVEGEDGVGAGALCGAAKLTAVADWRGGDSSGGGGRLELDGKWRRTARHGEGEGVRGGLGNIGGMREEGTGVLFMGSRRRELARKRRIRRERWRRRHG
uniref:DUF834 domain-containing protein n=1 Tax=Oryza barthii TaxID=65489 RepID=A0A0D3HBB8_9ORYZ